MKNRVLVSAISIILFMLPVYPVFSYEGVAELVPPTGIGRSVAVKGNIAYLLTREGDLYLYDLTPAYTSTSLAEIPPLPNSLKFNGSHDALILEDYLYVASDDLEIVDIKNPTAPVPLSTIDIPFSRTVSLTRLADLLIVGKFGGFDIFSLDNPAAPVKIGEYVSDNRVYGVAANQTYLYVSIVDQEGEPTPKLLIFDFSNPASPVLQNTILLDQFTYHLFIFQNRLITAEQFRVALWDLSQPTNPSFINAINSSAKVAALHVNRLVIRDNAINPKGTSLVLDEVFSTTGGQSDGFPYGSAIAHDGAQSLILLAQDESVFVVRDDTVGPTPQITGNLVTPGNQLTVQTTLDAGTVSDYQADWWLYAETPFGPFYFDPITSTWKSGFQVTYQGTLFDIGPLEVFNFNGLPPGSYDAVLGVDLNPNGVIDYNEFFDDRLDIDVQ